MSEWTQQDRERIELHRSGWSTYLIALYRDERLADVKRSINLYLEKTGEKLIEVD